MPAGVASVKVFFALQEIARVRKIKYCPIAAPADGFFCYFTFIAL